MLTESIINGNLEFNVPVDVIDNEVADLIIKLELKEGFDPHVVFDPAKHIIYKDSDFDEVKKFTLDDLKISKTQVTPISNLAVTDPVPIFSEEACDIMKWEAFQRKNIEKYAKSPSFSRYISATDFQISGYLDSAPFTLAAWKHPRTQDIINKFADINLKTMFDYEIATLNTSLVDSRKKIETEKSNEELEELSEDSKALFDWHYDSTSFTAVLMLSTNDDMSGGKTGLKNGNEEVIYINGPKKGYVTILQGRVVKHIATKPLSNDERISSIVAYIPESIHVPDTTVLTTVRPSVSPRSLYNEYYPQWIDYRFKRIEAQLADKRLELLKKMKEGKRFEQLEVVSFCKDISEYLKKSWVEFESVVENEVFPPEVFKLPYKDL
ncbi:uncharacterized protein PRCAT00004172001 [Priceomyces carsonii]|uniref:uncharacterized protein n=1 Tax=Priceomyces carsonii TaxID=28549 RepID=UPI002ED839FF|nr:unnamed protein product [Priceomyces carsonii]